MLSSVISTNTDLNLGWFNRVRRGASVRHTWWSHTVSTTTAFYKLTNTRVASTSPSPSSSARSIRSTVRAWGRRTGSVSRQHRVVITQTDGGVALTCFLRPACRPKSSPVPPAVVVVFPGVTRAQVSATRVWDVPVQTTSSRTRRRDGEYCSVRLRTWTSDVFTAMAGGGVQEMFFSWVLSRRHIFERLTCSLVFLSPCKTKATYNDIYHIRFWNKQTLEPRKIHVASNVRRIREWGFCREWFHQWTDWYLSPTKNRKHVYWSARICSYSLMIYVQNGIFIL